MASIKEVCDGIKFNELIRLNDFQYFSKDEFEKYAYENELSEVDDNDFTYWNQKSTGIRFFKGDRANRFESLNVKGATKSEIRNSSVALPKQFLDIDTGLFYVRDPNDMVSPDNGIVIAAADLTRYKAKIDSLKPEMFGAIGDGVADDTVAWQKTLDYAKATGYTIYANKLAYKISSTLTYELNDQFSDGVKIIGLGYRRTKFLCDMDGELLRINGNTSNSAGRHVCGGMIRDFAIEMAPGSTKTVHGISLKATQHYTVENVAMTSLTGDGVRLVATALIDVDANEFLTLRNLYIHYCQGWGINCFSTVPGAITLTLSLFDKVFVNSCARGMYFENIQSVVMQMGVCVTSTFEGIKFARNGSVSNLIELNRYELGNNNTDAPMLEIEAVKNFSSSYTRFVKNAGEGATEGIRLGTGPNPYLKNVEFIEPWVVQANANAVDYTWLYLAPGVIADNNVSIINPIYDAWAAGTKISDIAKLDYYELENTVIRAKGGTEVVLGNNAALIPASVGKDLVIVTFNATTAATVENPGGFPRADARKTYVVRNYGGASTLAWGNAFNMHDTALPAVGQTKTFQFLYSPQTAYWYQI